ncbi:nucleoside/nucleotide kinase family protein [Silicimonas sp. MF1-12-2]|uniref:nucleoside/nucleotide kinase family protein n=1 Tax=Silicimonas sp. MF1-12-2 TaxID=3384793 RepID=UPI0039B6984D
MTGTTLSDLDELARIVADRGREGRTITAIAGAPGSGKSTVSDMLAERLNAFDPGSAAVFPMDGYHYDDAILHARGHRPRKGAPFTFDVAGFGHMLARLRANTEDEIAVPVFDRALEISRNAARIIPGTVRHLIAEGNYLLLDRAPWSELRKNYDTSVFLDVPEATLEARLLERWKDLDGEELRAKMYDNDLPNALLVARQSSGWDFVLKNV